MIPPGAPLSWNHPCCGCTVGAARQTANSTPSRGGGEYCIMCGGPRSRGTKSGICIECKNRNREGPPCIGCGRKLSVAAIYTGSTRCRSCSTKAKWAEGKFAKQPRRPLMPGERKTT